MLEKHFVWVVVLVDEHQVLALLCLYFVRDALLEQLSDVSHQLACINVEQRFSGHKETVSLSLECLLDWEVLFIEEGKLNEVYVNVRDEVLFADILEVL